MKRLILAVILCCSVCLAAEPEVILKQHDASLQEVFSGFTSFVRKVKSEYEAGTLKQPKAKPPDPSEIYIEGFGWTNPQTLDRYLTLKPVELKYAVTNFGILAARIVLEPEKQPESWPYDKPLRYELILDTDRDGNWTPRTSLWNNAPKAVEYDSVVIAKSPVIIPNKKMQNIGTNESNSDL